MITCEQNITDQCERAADSLPDGTWHVANYMLEALEFHSPKDTGEGSHSWFHLRRGDHEFQFGNEHLYMTYQWKGTGEYVGRGRIKPDKAKCLVFFWKKIGRMTAWKGDLTSAYDRAAFARWARSKGMVPIFAWPRGVPPDPYVERAMEVTELFGIEDSYVRAMREHGVMVRG